MVVDALIIFSILARASKEYYVPLHKAGAYPLLLALLSKRSCHACHLDACNNGFLLRRAPSCALRSECVC